MTANAFVKLFFLVQLLGFFSSKTMGKRYSRDSLQVFSVNQNAKVVQFHVKVGLFQEWLGKTVIFLRLVEYLFSLARVFFFFFRTICFISDIFSFPS